ncbi:MAG: nitrophenyl compound nitroreductase subunit ArsF family protein [Candidatus Eisenbacteria bacterium]|jgi:hypothetical protein|nr:nitrophenyl compound nitroreductase subunit ArsF family protein [Candidatus Eisenbacteria bacterium]
MKFVVHLACILILMAEVSWAAPDSTSSARQDSLAASGASGPVDSTESPTGHRVIVYYFHRTLRCASCLSLEALTVKSLAGFTVEQEEGTLVWQPLNLDEPENEHFVDDFDLSFNTVVIAREEHGVRTSWKSLVERTWDLLEDEDRFIAFVRQEVENNLHAG